MYDYNYIISILLEDIVKKLELLSHLSPLERACVLQTTAASNNDDLEEFAK